MDAASSGRRRSGAPASTGGPDPATPAEGPEERHREAWKSPAGVSAIAAVVGSLVAAVALIVSTGGGEDDAAPSSGPTASETAPDAGETQDGPADPPVPASTTLSGVVPTVRLAAERFLGAEEEAGPSERRGTDVISADVPRSWTDWEVAPWLADDSDDRIGLTLVAAPDISRFYGYEDPGYFIGVSSLPATDPEAILENAERSWETGCVRVGENTISGRDGDGHYEIYRDCDPRSSLVLDVALSGDYALYLHVRLTDASQVDLLDAMIESLDVRPPIPVGEATGRGGDQTSP